MSERRSKWDEPNEANGRSASEAAAAAAAAAAKIAAQFKAAAPLSGGSQDREQSAEGRREREAHDGEFVHDIEINDLRNRYMLTKAQTQKQIHDDTGASVTTKGLWYPDKSMATSADPPLYLHVSAMSKESLDKAIEQVNEIINSEMPQLIEDRQAKRLEYEQRRAGPPQRREWVEEKVPIGLETLRNFNVRAKVVGPQGLFVKYIQNETGTRVQIKGQGSGFIETATGHETPEPMFISIAGPEAPKVAEAKELAADLIDAVKAEHSKAHQMMMQQWGPQQQGGYAGYQGGYQAGYGAGYQGQPGWDPSQQQQGYPAPSAAQGHYPPQPQGVAPPLPDDAPPPPPPEDEVPPPPAESAQPKKTPEEEALDKYWRDYIEWEKSFQAYHGRMPNKEEGHQDAPSEYR